jgi:hypothetical protein
MPTGKQLYILYMIEPLHYFLLAGPRLIISGRVLCQNPDLKADRKSTKSFMPMLIEGVNT